MEHDQSYKLLFSHPRMVEDLLRGFVREAWVQRVDFSTLERVSESFVSDELREREDDIIWRVRWGRRHWLYVYLLLEFQSTVDWFMAVRLMVYVGLLYQALIRSGEVWPGDKLPPVLPLVLYNGRQPWTAPLDVGDLIATRPVGLRPYRPWLRYLLLEERRYDDAELTPLQNVAAALFRLENSREPADVQQVVQALMAWLYNPGDDSIRRAFVVWLKRVLLPGRLPGVAVPEVQTLEEMHTMLAEQVREWTIQWKEAGLAEGRAEAERQALARERRLLLRLAQRRFDEATAQMLAPVLEAIDDPERFTSIAEAIVVCSSAEELLQQVRQSTLSPGQ